MDDVAIVASEAVEQHVTQTPLAQRSGHGAAAGRWSDPLPLLAQLERRKPGAFAIDYLEQGPDTWRLALVREAS
jgi:hypothetical protein